MQYCWIIFIFFLSLSIFKSKFIRLPYDRNRQFSKINPVKNKYQVKKNEEWSINRKKKKI